LEPALVRRYRVMHDRSYVNQALDKDWINSAIATTYRQWMASGMSKSAVHIINQVAAHTMTVLWISGPRLRAWANAKRCD